MFVLMKHLFQCDVEFLLLLWAVDILDAVGESVRKYEALYIGTSPVSKAMGK